MENLGYYNGKIAPIEEMLVPMNDRVCYFGDGVYEATMVNNHKIFALQDHIDRFFNSAGLVQIQLPFTKEELADTLNSLVKQVDSPEQMLYWQATRGTAPRNHVFPKGVQANLWVTIKPMKVKDQGKKLKLTTAEDTRFLHCNIKTLNLMINCRAANRAEELGCDESVFHRGDIVTECAHSNISIIKDGVFITHPTDHYILPGITRKHIIEICKEHNIPVDETPFTLEQLMDADEVLVSSSTQLCRSADTIEGKPVGGRAPELVKLIQDAYMDKYLKETK
ncbi:MAG: D-amino acid aminotransferase [Eubacteriales bacterium]|nr:D-amino acid aminotransferase [Eubacteriales bacterium]